MTVLSMLVILIVAGLLLYAQRAFFPELDAQLARLFRAVIIFIVIVCALIFLAGVFGLDIPLHIRLN